MFSQRDARKRQTFTITSFEGIGAHKKMGMGAEWAPHSQNAYYGSIPQTSVPF